MAITIGEDAVKIYVNGEEHTYAESVPLDAYVQVYISSEVE